MVRRTTTRRFCILLLLIRAGTCDSYAQPEAFTFKRLTVEDGLSQNSVYAILQDHRGFMWFGTKDGLNRYDGYTFTVFRHIIDDSTSISDNFVTHLFEDRRGSLWVGTQNGGLNVFDRKREKFYRVFLPGLVAVSKKTFGITDMTEDASGNLWIATEGAGLFKVTGEQNIGGNNRWSGIRSIIHYQHDPNDSGSLADNRIYSIFCDRDGILWIGSVAQLQTCDTRSENYTQQLFRPVRGSGAVPPREVLAIFEDARGDLWFGTHTGLIRFEKSGRSFHLFHTGAIPRIVRTISGNESGVFWLGTYTETWQFFSEQGRYADRPVRFPLTAGAGMIIIYRDRDGGTWFGSNGNGIFYHHPRYSRIQSFAASSGTEGWPGYSVRSLIEDSEGRCWVGSYGGLYVLDAQRSRFQRISSFVGYARAMLEDDRGVLWIASHGLAELNTGTLKIRWHRHVAGNAASIKSNVVSGILQDSKGVLWVVTGGTLSRFDPAAKRFVHHRFASDLEFSSDDAIPVGMHEDRERRIWLATETGLFRFDQTTLTFKRYVHETGNRTSLSYSVTLSLCPDPAEPDRFLWIGTAGGGLNRLDLATEEFTAFTDAHGLPNNVVYAVLADRNGKLWLSTNNGLARFDPRTLEVHHYIHADGLQGNEYNAGAYYRSSSGRLFFGGINGFDTIVPEEMFVNASIPPVVMTELRLFNEPVAIGTDILQEAISETKKLTFSYDQNLVTLEFASLDFTTPEKNQYRYKLEGFMQNYIPTGTKRTATFTNLDPGHYVFRVQGSNSDGVWNKDGASIELVILPPFWMTWWFRGLVVVVFLSVGPFIYWRRVTALKEEKQRQMDFSQKLIEREESERKRIAGELHDSLGQNLLVMKNRAVLGLRDPMLPGDLHEHLTEISNTASATLKEVREISHNLRPYELDRFGITETIRSVMEKMGGSSKLDFTSEVEDVDGLLSKEFEINVYRIVQECLSNIVKHAGATRARMSISKNATSIQVVVQDNGKGFAPGQSDHRHRREGGLGLASLDERIRIIGGAWTIDSAPGSGTTITMTIPIDRAANGA